MRLGEPLPCERFAVLRRRLSLEHCKWDAQVGDHTALCSAPLWLTRSEWQELSSLSEQLFRETLARALAWLRGASPRRRRDRAYGRFWQQGG